MNAYGTISRSSFNTNFLSSGVSSGEYQWYHLRVGVVPIVVIENVRSQVQPSSNRSMKFLLNRRRNVSFPTRDKPFYKNDLSN